MCCLQAQHYLTTGVLGAEREFPSLIREKKTSPKDATPGFALYHRGASLATQLQSCGVKGNDVVPRGGLPSAIWQALDTQHFLILLALSILCL